MLTPSNRPIAVQFASMNRIRSHFMRATVFLFALFAPVVVFAHPGGVDANGGHSDRKTGIYHYHRGTNALVQSPSVQTNPALSVIPLQSESAAPVSSSGDIQEKRIEMEAGAAEYQEKPDASSSVSALSNVPWWAYLVVIGCGYGLLELASYYYQKQRGRR